MPVEMQSALIFHYNLKFYNKDTDNFEGVSLKRFVMQVWGAELPIKNEAKY